MRCNLDRDLVSRAGVEQSRDRQEGGRGLVGLGSPPLLGSPQTYRFWTASLNDTDTHILVHIEIYRTKVDPLTVKEDLNQRCENFAKVHISARLQEEMYIEFGVQHSSLI